MLCAMLCAMLCRTVPQPTTTTLLHAALYPIDTIKTRLQAMIGGGGFKALMSSGGGKGLYAGVWGNLAGECVLGVKQLDASGVQPIMSSGGAGSK